MNGENVLKLIKTPGAKILSYSAVCGKKEKEGPLGGGFDHYSEDDRFSAPTFEKAEENMQAEAYCRAVKKAGENAPEAIIAGDLMNQCTASSIAHKDTGLPYIGLYGACSTLAEALALGAVLVSHGAFEGCACQVSSHNCTAERQYRTPLEYGGQRPPTAQWTVTASACFVLGREGGAEISEVFFGRIVDMGINDPCNMGAAMAPAAADTLYGYFKATGTSPRDYDMIYTGDLGREGSGILCEIMESLNCSMSGRHEDCGRLIYSAKDDVHSGGSGAGCSGGVLAAHILPGVERGELKNVLFVATGALHSPSSLAQGGTIPGIAHLIRIIKGA